MQPYPAYIKKAEYHEPPLDPVIVMDADIDYCHVIDVQNGVLVHWPRLETFALTREQYLTHWDQFAKFSHLLSHIQV